MRLRTLCITLSSAAVVATLAVVAFDRGNQPQDPLAALAAGNNGQSELRQLKQLEAELAALKTLSGSAKGSDRDRMESQLNALKKEVSQLGKTLATVETERSPAAPDVASDEPTNIAQQMAAEEEQTQQQGQFLEAALAREAADPVWSVTAAQEISRTLGDTRLEHTRLGEVRCGSTVCRIDVSHDSVDAEQGFIMQLGQLESFRQSEGFAQRVERSDGSVATTMFISRSGHRLPNPSGGTT
jgi:phage host-nuclease inhibitor protein Gam